jgi:CheY-like chemotaxis protein
MGYRVRTAAEPFEGTARFIEAPPDLVLLSLTDFGSRDMGFLRTVRRRAPTCRVVLLVPEGRRETARRALKAGADVWIPEPFHTEELEALVQALVAPADGVLDLQGEGGRAVRVLAREVAHAVNNPLQVLRLLGEEGSLPEGTADTLVGQVDRVRHVMRILEGFAKLKRPAHLEGRLGAALRTKLEVAAEEGSIRLASPLPTDGPVSVFDTRQVSYAIDCTLEFLGALSSERPLPLKAAVHRLTPRQGRALGPAHRRAVKAGRYAEIAFKGRDVHLDADAFRTYERHVIWNHERTRHAHPGLAPVSLVARHHAGRLIARPAPGGTVLGIALPLA